MSSSAGGATARLGVVTDRVVGVAVDGGAGSCAVTSGEGGSVGGRAGAPGTIAGGVAAAIERVGVGAAVGVGFTGAKVVAGIVGVNLSTIFVVGRAVVGRLSCRL